jgi:hypothetical protein
VRPVFCEELRVEWEVTSFSCKGGRATGAPASLECSALLLSPRRSSNVSIRLAEPISTVSDERKIVKRLRSLPCHPSSDIGCSSAVHLDVLLSHRMRDDLAGKGRGGTAGESLSSTRASRIRRGRPLPRQQAFFLRRSTNCVTVAASGGREGVVLRVVLRRAGRTGQGISSCRRQFLSCAGRRSGRKTALRWLGWCGERRSRTERGRSREMRRGRNPESDLVSSRGRGVSLIPSTCCSQAFSRPQTSLSLSTASPHSLNRFHSPRKPSTLLSSTPPPLSPPSSRWTNLDRCHLSNHGHPLRSRRRTRAHVCQPSSQAHEAAQRPLPPCCPP